MIATTALNGMKIIENEQKYYRGGVKLKPKVTYAVGQTKSAVFKNGQFSEMSNTVGKTKKLPLNIKVLDAVELELTIFAWSKSTGK